MSLLAWLITKKLAGRTELLRALYDSVVTYKGTSPLELEIRYGVPREVFRSARQRYYEKAKTIGLSIHAANYILIKAVPWIIENVPIKVYTDGDGVYRCLLCRGRAIDERIIVEDHIVKKHRKYIARYAEQIKKSVFQKT